LIKFVIQAFGQRKTIKAWVEDDRCCVSYVTLLHRINTGWNPEKAIITTPSRKNRAKNNV